MAPSRIEENEVTDFDAPLKAAPKLVAPEPGMYIISLLLLYHITKRYIERHASA